jgi:nicotinamide-nucleotide amidase
MPPALTIELLNTGSELLRGRIPNAHQQWLCRRLADLGHVVTRQVAVPDTAPAIQSAVREALGRTDLVIVTGGLGPTSDDLTRDSIAQLLGRKLRPDDAVLAHIKRRFASRRLPTPKNNEVQALVPEGARVLWNPHGTAPGLALEVRPNPFRAGGQASWLIMLPGPAHELRPMFDDIVLPLLREQLPPAEPFIYRTLRTTGVGESVVQAEIAGPLRPLVEAGLELGYCAKPGQVDVHLAAHGARAEKLVSEAEALARARLGLRIFGEGDDELETVVIRLLTERKRTLALAESCTGGCLAHKLTNVPGASAVFLGGLVTYSNEAKQKLLGVRPETLSKHGAVSEAVAREMADGARARLGAHYAIAVTGTAGPDGGTAAKPVGTVFIALAWAAGVEVQHLFNPWNRLTFKEVTAQQALERLRSHLVRAD